MYDSTTYNVGMLKLVAFVVGVGGWDYTGILQVKEKSNYLKVKGIMKIQ